MNSRPKRAPVSKLRPLKFKMNDGGGSFAMFHRAKSITHYDFECIFRTKSGDVFIEFEIDFFYYSLYCSENIGNGRFSMRIFHLFAFRVYSSLILLYTLWFWEIENFKHQFIRTIYSWKFKINIFYVSIKTEWKFIKFSATFDKAIL